MSLQGIRDINNDREQREARNTSKVCTLLLCSGIDRYQTAFDGSPPMSALLLLTWDSIILSHDLFLFDHCVRCRRHILPSETSLKSSKSRRLERKDIMIANRALTNYFDSVTLVKVSFLLRNTTTSSQVRHRNRSKMRTRCDCILYLPTRETV